MECTSMQQRPHRGMCPTAEACLYPEGFYNEELYDASPLLGCLHAVCTTM